MLLRTIKSLIFIDLQYVEIKGFLLSFQDKPAVAAHYVCLHVSATDRLQHEETHVQDALQGGRPGMKTPTSVQNTVIHSI